MKTTARFFLTALGLLWLVSPSLTATITWDGGGGTDISGSAAHANLILNGSFEEGNWTGIPGGDNWVAIKAGDPSAGNVSS